MTPGQSGLGDRLLGEQPSNGNPFGQASGAATRYKIYIIVAVALAIGTMLLQGIRADPTPEPLGITGKPASRPATLDPRADKEAWIGDAAGRVKKTEDNLANLTTQVNQIQDEMRRNNEETQKLLKGQADKVVPEKVIALAPSNQGVGRAAILPPANVLPPQPSAMSGLPNTASQGAGSPQSAQSAGVGQPPVPSNAVPVNRIRVFSPEILPNQGPSAPAKYVIPTGTMIPVKLLTGLDAPGKSSAVGGEPHPVLMFVEDMSILPNNVQMDMRECFILGEGIGELSQERAKIRTQNLSCIKNADQTAVDIRIAGVMIGQDGSIGLRGPVVQREGAILAKALLAGFVQGVSRIFQPYQQGFVIAPSPQQAFNFPSPHSIGLAGAAGAMGGGAQVLANHYTQLAKEIYPIIEIQAGRQGTIVITEGRTIHESPL